MKQRNMVPLLVMLCVIGTLILTVGIAQARFRENWTETLPFRPEGEENLILRQDGDWISDQNVQKLTFSLENADTEAAAGELYVLVSEGIENPDKLVITLDQEVPAGATMLIFAPDAGSGWSVHSAPATATIVSE